MTDIDVTVIGGGAAGLMAAVSAARFGARTRVIGTHGPDWEKILSTGNGKCNYTKCSAGAFLLSWREPLLLRCLF